MRGDKNIRRAGKGAAASRAYEALSGSESAEEAATAAHHLASQGGKEAVSHAAKQPWHTAPWESAKAAFGAKGAAALAVVGGATAVGLVAVATVALAGGGKGGDGVDASLGRGDKDGGREISSGGKDDDNDDDDDTTTTGAGDDEDSTTTVPGQTTTSTVPGQTTTTVRGQTTTTQRSTTPGGPTTTTTRPRVTTTTTRPRVTTTTTTTPRPVPPTIRSFTATRATGACQIRGQVFVSFKWSGAGTVTSGNVVVTKTGALVHSGITKPSDGFAHCVDVSSASWTLTLYNGNVSASKTAPLQ